MKTLAYYVVGMFIALLIVAALAVAVACVPIALVVTPSIAVDLGRHGFKDAFDELSAIVRTAKQRTA